MRGNPAVMTTATHTGQQLTVAGVRPLRHVSQRLRVVGGSGPVRWWHPRLALAATLAGAMAGALLGVVQGFVVQGAAPIALLEEYGRGAGLGASIGLVVALLAGLLIGLAHRYVLPQVVRRRQVWVRYRRR